MTDTSSKKLQIDQAKEDLFNYAIDREEIKWLMESLRREADIDRTAVAYELQALKIVAIGWAISYHMGNSPHKNALLQMFWNKVQEFSRNLSNTTSTMTGADINYFEVLKDRLDGYVQAISTSPEALASKDPAAAIGPKFAALCGNGDDIFTRMTGMSMFMTNVARTGQYLQETGLKSP
jgi:hypothetical protein